MNSGKVLSIITATTSVLLIINTASAAPATDLDCLGCVNPRDLAINSIYSAKIKNGEVKTDDIADSAINSQKIMSGAVSTGALGNNSVTTVKIQNGAVSTAKISNRAITSQKILNGAVKTNQIFNASVTSAKIKNGEVKTEDLGMASVTSDKIKNGQVKNEDIARNTIGSGRIKDGEVKTQDIDEAAVTLDKLSIELQSKIHQLDSLIDSTQEVLGYFDLTYITDPNTGAEYPTLRITGANLQIINGIAQNVANGTGNLLVGNNITAGAGQFAETTCSNGVYNTQIDCSNAGYTWSRNHRSGSHNIILGSYNSYSSHGGIIGGEANTINGVGANVIGGFLNVASGSGSSVISGKENIASGVGASVTGGSENTASGDYSSVSGGAAGTVDTQYDWMGGDNYFSNQ